MTRLALALTLIAAPALADTVNLKGSTVTLRPTERPGALAEGDTGVVYLFSVSDSRMKKAPGHDSRGSSNRKGGGMPNQRHGG